MYHQDSGDSSRIVTIQYPRVLIVMDYGDMHTDPDGHIFPTMMVFSDVPVSQLEGYLEGFGIRGSLEEELSTVIVDSWPDNVWAENSDDKVENRYYKTTFVEMSSVREILPVLGRVRGKK